MQGGGWVMQAADDRAAAVAPAVLYDGGNVVAFNE